MSPAGTPPDAIGMLASLVTFFYFLTNVAKQPVENNIVLPRAQTLPLELLGQIFALVLTDDAHGKGTLSNCTLVCRVWGLASSALLLRHIRIPQHQDNLITQLAIRSSIPFLRNGVSLTPRLALHARVLTVENSDVDFLALCDCLAQCTNLQELSLINVAFYPPQTYSNAPPTRSLQINKVSITETHDLLGPQRKSGDYMLDILALFHTVSYLHVDTIFPPKTYYTAPDAKVNVKHLSVTGNLKGYWPVVRDGIATASVEKLTVGSMQSNDIQSIDDVIGHFREGIRDCEIGNPSQLPDLISFGTRSNGAGSSVPPRPSLAMCNSLRVFKLSLRPVSRDDTRIAWKFWMSSLVAPLESLTIAIDFTASFFRMQLHDPDAYNFATMITLIGALDWAYLDQCIDQSPDLPRVHLDIRICEQCESDTDAPKDWRIVGPPGPLQDLIRSKVSDRTRALLHFSDV